MEDEPVRDENGYLYAYLYDWFLMPDGNGEVVGYGIRTLSCHTRFVKMSFLTRRRYSEYRDFWRFIQSRYTEIQLPPLPFPDDFVPELDSPPTIARRYIIFRAYFANFIRIPQVFNDPSFPLFCQTHMTMAEIRTEIERQERSAAGYSGADNNQAAAIDGNNNAEQPRNVGNQFQQRAAERNNRQIEEDELIFHMEDI